MPCLRLSLLVCLCVSLQAGAQQAATPSAIPPDGAAITGTWSCEGTFRNQQVHRAGFTAALILDGKWLELTEQDTQPATGYRAKYLIGFDAQQKRVVEFDANNFGAAVYSSAEGWKDGVLTMTSAITQDAKAPYAANRFVYTIQNKDAFTVDWQISRSATLSWVTADHLACKRAAS